MKNKTRSSIREYTINGEENFKVQEEQSMVIGCRFVMFSGFELGSSIYMKNHDGNSTKMYGSPEVTSAYARIYQFPLF